MNNELNELNNVIFKIGRRNYPIFIDLDTPEGDEEVLLLIARRMSKQLGFDSERVFIELSCSKTFEDFLEAFQSYFGDYVVLETEKTNLQKAIA